MTDPIEVQALPVDVILNTVLDGLVVINETGEILSFNPAAEKIFQYRSDEVIGKNVKVLMPEPYHSEHDGYLSNFIETGDKKVIGVGREVLARRKNGSIFPMELGVNEMNVKGGRLFLGTIRDISERQRAIEQLDAETNRLQAVLNTVLDGILTINRYGIVQSFNPGAERIFGYSASEVVGQNIKCLMPEPYHSQHDQYLINYLTTGEKKVIGLGRQVTAKRKDGTDFPIELGVSEMDDCGEKMFVGTIRDVTERAESECSIQNYLEMLTRSNQELDDFAYIASHDLKEPLRGLSNNALFLQEDYESVLDEDGNRRIERMRYLCQRLEQLVDDLLYYSRLGRQDLAIQEANLNVLIDDIVMLMEASLHEANAEVIIPEPLPTIVCDLPRITEVFRNLITNAVKYNDKESKIIEVGCLKPSEKIDYPDQLVFYVKDNGIGIRKEFYGDIFRIFKRLNDEEDSVKGTGVGLTFVQKIIERHGGSIWLESEVNVGTTFFFNLNLQGLKS